VGMDFLHKNGGIHGDLKASNVLVDDGGKACISDFGLSEVRQESETISQALRERKANGPVTGTMRWMSPERLKGGALDAKVDVYAFAMTCYEVWSSERLREAPPLIHDGADLRRGDSFRAVRQRGGLRSRRGTQDTAEPTRFERADRCRVGSCDAMLAPRPRAAPLVQQYRLEAGGAGHPPGPHAEFYLAAAQRKSALAADPL
ncbi:kinase-like protein, partial [Auricularia subglabra TFB-10046 SS5]